MNYLVQGRSDLWAFFSKVRSTAAGVTIVLNHRIAEFSSVQYFPECPFDKSLMNKLNYGSALGLHVHLKKEKKKTIGKCLFAGDVRAVSKCLSLVLCTWNFFACLV